MCMYISNRSIQGHGSDPGLRCKHCNKPGCVACKDRTSFFHALTTSLKGEKIKSEKSNKFKENHNFYRKAGHKAQDFWNNNEEEEANGGNNSMDNDNPLKINHLATCS